MRRWNQTFSVAMVLILAVLCMAGCGKKKEENKVADEITQSVQEAAELANDESGETEETQEEIIEEPVDTRTPVQKFWGGDWYGIMWFTYGSGNYEVYANQYWDAMATIDVDESGDAEIVMWYEAQDRDTPVADVKMTISEDSGSGEMGAAISESGWAFVNSDTGNGDIDHAEWIIDPMTDPVSAKYGNDMIHIEGEFIDGSGSYYYHFFFRKWGTLWEDVAEDPEMLLPGLYYDWYKPLVEDGYAMPENIGDEGSVKMSDLDSNAQANAPSSNSDTDSSAKEETSSAPKGGSTYDGSRMVLLDNEYCTVTVNGTGCNPYNDSWIGYMFELTNKSDFSIYFASYAEMDTNEQTLSSLGKGDTCYYNGELCKTHFGNTIKAGASMDNACLAIDGVTDVSQLGNVQGYIAVVNNETGEVLYNIPYSF